MSGRDWGKAPIPWVRDVQEGKHTPAEVRVGACIAYYHGTLSAAQLADVTGLSERAVRYALRGRPGRGPGLSAWVHKVGRRWSWRSVRQFARVTYRDVQAMAQSATRHAFQVWAYILLRLETAKPWTKLQVVVGDVARCTGLTAYQTKRAIYGRGSRLGAVQAGLVDLVDGVIRRRSTLARDRGREATFRPRREPREPAPSVQKPPPPVCSSDPPPCTRGLFQEGSGRRVELLEDLAQLWSRDNNPTDWEGFRVFLKERRQGVHRGRDWAPGILRAVLGEVGSTADDDETRSKARQLFRAIWEVEEHTAVPRPVRRQVSKLRDRIERKSGHPLARAYASLVTVFREHYYPLFAQLEAGQ